MTGAPQRTLYRQAARFEREGMASLFGPPKVERHRTLPEHIRRHILALKAEHPAFRANEIAKIFGVHFGRRPSLHTVKRILAETPPMPVTTRRYPPYHRIAAPDARRHAVLSLHSEDWQKTSIAAYLQIDARTVYEILRRWLAEGVPGLDDKSHARIGPRKTDLQAILTVKQLQENPDSAPSAFMPSCANSVSSSARRVPSGQMRAHPRGESEAVRVQGADAQPEDPKATPLHRRLAPSVLERGYPPSRSAQRAPAHIGMKVYCVSILENYSRAILASGVFATQDLSAYLMIL